MQNALFGIFRKALVMVQMDGMPRVPGIVVDFDLTNPEVIISSRLQDLYQKEMTIVLEHWFEDLEVKEEGFWVTLNFSDIPEHLYIPYLSIIYFFDQQANIGFQIPRYGQPGDVGPVVELSKEAPSQTTGKVVSLDDFRTK
ncbi:MAG: ClpXP protease specificity-enhancing factor SspB [Rhodobacteraceae bacterium]|nr:ClpXP protease specificity-enhancing factor SspB [Paracoccaceae bacterium]MCY4251479.1 ClpXP protease specificity-enhancing factor SspB [Paracoccaceae bacterium]